MRFPAHQTYPYAFPIFLIATFVPLAISSMVSGPVYQSDEGGYLANALALSGYVTDAATGWHAGYSLLLVPAVLFGEDPIHVFSYVKLTNALFLGANSIIIMRLLTKSLSQPEQDRVAISTVIAILYPSYVILVGFAFSSIAFLFFFSLSAYLIICVSERGRWWWIPLGIVCGYLYWIHPLGVAVIAAVATVGLFLARWRDEYPWLAAMIIIALFLAAVYKITVDPYIKTHLMAVGDFARDPGYPSIAHMLSTLVTEHYLTEVFQKFFGQLFYAVSTTYGLVAILLTLTVTHRLMSAKPSLSSAGVACAFYSTISIFFVAVVASIFLAKSDTMQSTFYGRYIEMVMLPALALGIYLYSYNSIRAALILILALGVGIAGLITYTGSLSTGVNLVNALSLWQVVRIPYSENGILSAAWVTLVWMSTAAAVMGWMLAVRSMVLVFGAVLFMFAYAIFTQMQERAEAVESYVEPKLEMAQIVRTVAPSGNCVLFDEEGGYEVDTPNVYSFYFVGFEFRKLRIDKWETQCSGVILSTRPHLDDFVKGVVPVSINANDGLIAWVSAKDYKQHSLRYGGAGVPVPMLRCLPRRCLQKTRFSETDQTKVGILQKSTLASNGNSGFLLYGPYKPLVAGEYALYLYGSAETVQSAWVDVVSNESETQHLKIEFSETGKRATLAQGRFRLDTPVNDVEIRVYVGQNDVIQITGYKLHRIQQAH